MEFIICRACVTEDIWWIGWELRICSEYWTSSWPITFATLCPTSATSCSHSCSPWRRTSMSIAISAPTIPRGKPRLWCSRLRRSVSCFVSVLNSCDDDCVNLTSWTALLDGLDMIPTFHPQMEWAIPAFAFPATAGTHLLTPEGWKAEKTLVRNSPAEIRTCNHPIATPAVVHLIPYTIWCHVEFSTGTWDQWLTWVLAGVEPRLGGCRSLAEPRLLLSYRNEDDDDYSYGYQ